MTNYRSNLKNLEAIDLTTPTAKVATSDDWARLIPQIDERAERLRNKFRMNQKMAETSRIKLLGKDKTKIDMTIKRSALSGVFLETSNQLIESAPPLIHESSEATTSLVGTTGSTQAEVVDTAAEAAGLEAIDGFSAIELLPWVGETAMGLKVLYDVRKVWKNNQDLELDMKKRLCVMRAVQVVQRFGITYTFSFIGGTAGAAVGSSAAGVGAIPGSLVGSGAGILTSIPLKKMLEEEMDLVALKASGLTPNSIFLLRNHSFIDSFSELTSRTLTVSESVFVKCDEFYNESNESAQKQPSLEVVDQVIV